MSIPEGGPSAPFDPFQKFIWGRYFGPEDPAERLAALEEREAVVALFVPEEAVVAAAVSRVASLRPRDLHVAVVMDAKPVEPGHMVVISGFPRPYDHEETPRVVRRGVDAAASWTRQYARGSGLSTDSGVGTYIFGEEVPTAHAHVLPRANAQSGLAAWADERRMTSLEERRAILDTMGRPDQDQLMAFHAEVTHAILSSLVDTRALLDTLSR